MRCSMCCSSRSRSGSCRKPRASHWNRSNATCCMACHCAVSAIAARPRQPAHRTASMQEICARRMRCPDPATALRMRVQTMAETPAAQPATTLRRVLGTWDLVLFNIAAIVALRWLSVAAQVGPSSMVLWLLGLLGFFLPLALAVLDLSSRVPGEGGLYLWSKAAFGDLHGFVTGWTYWVSNLAYFPSMLLFGAGVFLRIGGPGWMSHADDGRYNLIYGLIVLWAATLLSILG